MQPRPLDDLDPVARLSACRQWDEAAALARRDLDALRQAPKGPPLALARATRRLADVLLEAGRPEEATDLVLEARRLYRPLMSEPGPLAEIQLTIANHAYMTLRSLEAEAALDVALKATEKEPPLRLLFARALRFQAHMEILRGEFERGAELIDVALRQTSSDDSESLLLRLQYLFTRAELHVMLGERDRGREAVRAALDLLSTKFAADADLHEHGRGRAVQIYTVNGDAELAAQLAPTSADRGDP